MHARAWLIALAVAAVFTAALVPPSGAASADTAPDRRLAYLPLHPESYARAKADAAAQAGGPHATPPGAPAATRDTSGPGGFEGLSDTGTPPDTTGAIGPSRYIEMVNVRMGIYGRDGTVLNAIDLGDLTGHRRDFLADPQVFWDPTTNRFYYEVLDFGTRVTAWGFSRTPDPTSVTDFCNYTTDFGYTNSRFGMMLPDFPKLGASQNFLLIGVNVFVRGSYVGSDVDWIAKPTSVGNIDTCPDVRSFKTGVLPKLKNADGSLASTPVPAVPTDRVQSDWVVANADVSTGGTANFLTVFQISRDNATGSANMHQTGTAVPVAPYAMPPNAPQAGSPYLLDTSDGRLEHAMAGVDPRFGPDQPVVWTAHAVAGGAGAEERWYEIDPVHATVLQQGVVSDPQLYVWNGAISSDRSVGAGPGAFGSGMALGVSTSSAADLPAIQMVTKAGAAPQSALTLVHGSLRPAEDSSCAVEGVCEWGDYSGASPDPAAPTDGGAGTVWLANQWNVKAGNQGAANWSTWIWPAAPSPA